MTEPTPSTTDAYYSRLIITDLEEMRDLERENLKQIEEEGEKLQERIDYLDKVIHVVHPWAKRAALATKGELDSSPLSPLVVGDSCVVSDGARHTHPAYFSRTGEVIELKPHGPGTISVRLDPLEEEDAEDMKERSFIFFESAVQPLQPESDLAGSLNPPKSHPLHRPVEEPKDGEEGENR